MSKLLLQKNVVTKMLDSTKENLIQSNIEFLWYIIKNDQYYDINLKLLFF